MSIIIELIITRCSKKCFLISKENCIKGERRQKVPLSIQDVYQECKPAQPKKNCTKKHSLKETLSNPQNLQSKRFLEHEQINPTPKVTKKRLLKPLNRKPFIKKHPTIPFLPHCPQKAQRSSLLSLLPLLPPKAPR